MVAALATIANTAPKAQWVSAAPLWDAYESDPARMQSPALLRFASDTFMEDLDATLQRDPAGVSDLVAVPESFRARPTGASADWRPTLSQLKLYQPAHGHFYMVSASLVCRLAGLPDRTVDVAGGDKVSFVLRRIAQDGNEMAWTNDPASGKRWQELAADASGEFGNLAPFEELLPLFPMNFSVEGKRRRLHVGLVPTSSRETFQAAPALSPIQAVERDPATNQVKDPRMEEAETRFLARLDDWVEAPTSTNAVMRRGETEASLFLLLDFAEFLSFNLPALWQNIHSGTRPTTDPDRTALYDLLATSRVDNNTTWQQALRAVWDQAARITEAEPGLAPTNLSYNLNNSMLNAALVTSMRQALKRALGTYTPSSAPPSQPSPESVPVPKMGPADTLYVLRCVYQRPACGPLQPATDLLSKATRRFAIAPFFDFDAPARKVRISLPIDTSIAGLRKFDKNVAFMISDKLREQMSSITDLKKALDGELASEEGFDLGVICSFSLPIITICALVLLLIFVYVLNIVFWWVPFFRFCLPLGLKAK